MKRKITTLILCISVFIANAQDTTLKSTNSYIFLPGDEITVPPNATITLKVKQIVNDIPGDAFIKSEQWTIGGKALSNQNPEEGNFKLTNLQFDKVTYTAPSKVPQHNPVLITLSFQPEGEQTKIILYCRIHILDKKNYFYLNSRNTSEGLLYELKEPLAASSRTLQETAYYVNDQWNIGVTGFQKLNENDSVIQSMGFGLGVKGNGPGTYRWSVYGDDKTGLIPPCNTVTVNGTGRKGSSFLYVSADWLPHGGSNCKLVALDGSTTITVFDRKNKIIKGYFSGILISPNFEYVSVSGAFSVTMH